MYGAMTDSVLAGEHCIEQQMNPNRNSMACERDEEGERGSAYKFETTPSLEEISNVGSGINALHMFPGASCSPFAASRCGGSEDLIAGARSG